jgi:hypothetical protein
MRPTNIAGITIAKRMCGTADLSLKDAPIPRAVQAVGRILCLPILGGLHTRRRGRGQRR